jgi:hypothetical protein
LTEFALFSPHQQEQYAQSSATGYTSIVECRARMRQPANQNRVVEAFRR